MKKALTLLIALLIVAAFALPVMADESTTVHFYSNDSRMEKVFLFVMEPALDWAQPETGGWPGIELTKGADGWYSYELLNDVLTHNYFIMFHNGFGDDNKPSQIKWCQAPIERPAEYTTSGLWMTTIPSGDPVPMIGGDTEIPLTAFATKAEAEAALGLDGSSDTPSTPTNPKTGDSAVIYIAVGVLALAACGTILVVRKVKA